MEHAKIRSAMWTVKANIRWLENRMNSIHLDGKIGQKMNEFFINKIAVQKSLLDWLIRYENNCLNGTPVDKKFIDAALFPRKENEVRRSA